MLLSIIKAPLGNRALRPKTLLMFCFLHAPPFGTRILFLNCRTFNSRLLFPATKYRLYRPNTSLVLGPWPPPQQQFRPRKFVMRVRSLWLPEQVPWHWNGLLTGDLVLLRDAVWPRLSSPLFRYKCRLKSLSSDIWKKDIGDEKPFVLTGKSVSTRKAAFDYG